MTSLVEEITIYVSCGIIAVLYIVAVSLLVSIKNRSYSTMRQLQNKKNKNEMAINYTEGIYNIHKHTSYLSLCLLPIVILIIYILIAKEFDIFPFGKVTRSCPSGTIDPANTKAPSE